MNDKLPASSRAAKQTMQKAGEALVRLAGWPLVRLGVLGLFVVVQMWLLYDRVWRPMRDEVPLPPGVTEQNPGLDLPTLRSINSARAARVLHEPSSFEAAGRVLVEVDVEDDR